MLTTTAKTAAERKREQRERQKQNRLKDVTFTLEQATIDIVTSHSKQQGLSQSDYVNSALKKGVTSHDNGSLQAENDKLIELEAKSLNCFKCVHWLDDSCRKGLTLSGWACDSVESWQAEIERLNAEITRLTSEETLHYTGFNNDLIIENKALKKLLAQIKHATDNKQSSVLIGLINDNSHLFLGEPEPEPEKPLDREFTAAEKKQIRAMAKNQLENLKGNESVKDRQKLASLAGAFSKKLYLELYDLGYLERI